MMKVEDRLDFEEEDRLLSTSLTTTTTTTTTTKKRKRVIGLDDLLSDHYTEGSAKPETKLESKAPRFSSLENEDNEEVKEMERKLHKFMNDCQKVHELNVDDDRPLWGHKLFGHQKVPPSNLLALGDSKLLKSLTSNHLNLPVDVNAEKGSDFLESLLKNGWLSKLVVACGSVEDSITSWTFYMMLYSPDKELQASACDFWCSVLFTQSEAGVAAIRTRWLPKHSDFKDALHIYGYQSDTSSSYSSPSGAVQTESDCEGPPLNIISWIKVLSACCQLRTVQPFCSSSEAEEFLGVMILLSLDRNLQGLAYTLHDCMLSLIGYFMDDEWDSSCKNVSRFLTHRTFKDSNCLRLVECIPVDNQRCKQIKSEVSFGILLTFFNDNVADHKDILEALLSIDVKDKDCDFFKLYMYLVLVENCLWLSGLSDDNRPVLLEMWSALLRRFSSQITAKDWRHFALKVRNKASFLLQNKDAKSEISRYWKT